MTSVERTLFWILFALAFGFFSYRIVYLYRLLDLGVKKKRKLPEGSIKETFFHLLAQRCSLKSIKQGDLAGIGHAFIFWGFLLFAVNDLLYLFIGEGMGLSPVIMGTAFSRYFLIVLDIAGLLVLFGVIWAALRRYLIRPERLDASLEAGLILLLLGTLMILHFVLGGLSISTGKADFGGPVATGIAFLVNGCGVDQGVQAQWTTLLWWTRYLIILGFLIYIPYSKHLHILASPFNILLKTTRPPGALSTIDLEECKHFGVSQVDEFSSKQLLESYSCAECGRCKVSCPAHLTGKSLIPRDVVLEIKNHLLAKGPNLLAIGKKTPSPERKGFFPALCDIDGLLSCTTCGACMDVCPVMNRHTDIIVDLRRDLVYRGIFDPGHKKALQRIADNYNPYGMPWNIRAKNTGIQEAEEGGEYDLLYWVGCAASYDDRAREIARSVSKIVERAGITIAMLGSGEKCCGDFVRRIGDEGLFQRLARENIEAIGKIRFKKIITHCPHCYNTLKNEYPAFGATFEVLHHSEFLLQLIAEGKITVNKIKKEITYHDPCYLGRYNEIYAAPREILTLLSERLVELPRSRSESLCCGAGGGHMWKDTETGKKLNIERIEEVMASGAPTLATACPFCLLMFEEALQLQEKGDLKIKDIAELVDDAQVY